MSELRVTFCAGADCAKLKISPAVEAKVAELRVDFDGVLLALDRRNRTAWAFAVRDGALVDVAAARGSGLVIRNSLWRRFPGERPQLLADWLRSHLRRIS